MDIHIVDHPEIYRIGFDLEELAFTVSCGSQTAKNVCDKISERGIQRTDGLNVDPFVVNETTLGYGGAIRFSSPTKHSVLWTCPFPDSKNAEDLTGGQWRKIFNAAASISVLLQTLNAITMGTPKERSPTTEINGMPTQLVCVETQTSCKDMYGSPIYATMSRQGRLLLQRIRTSEDDQLAVIKAAITAARDSLCTLSAKGLRRITREADSSSINIFFFRGSWRICLISLGGSLFVEPDCERDVELGVELTCHNTDSPLHQLPLLAGFAKFCETLYAMR